MESWRSLYQSWEDRFDVSLQRQRTAEKMPPLKLTLQTRLIGLNVALDTFFYAGKSSWLLARLAPATRHQSASKTDQSEDSDTLAQSQGQLPPSNLRLIAHYLPDHPGQARWKEY